MKDRFDNMSESVPSLYIKDYGGCVFSVWGKISGNIFVYLNFEIWRSIAECLQEYFKYRNKRWVLFKYDFKMNK